MAKRLGFPLMLLCGSLMLSSCEAHFFDYTFDIPWWIIAIFVFAVLFIAHCIIIGGEYKCPHCGTVFKPKWYELSAWIHVGNDRVMRCPCCSKKGFCNKAE